MSESIPGLKIRKTQVKDIDTVVLMENEVENAAFILANTKDEHLILIEDKDVEHLILTSEDDKILGFIILAGLQSGSIELRRIVIKEKGKGFGRKAIKKIKRFCFQELKCHRLWLDVLESNERARHLYLSEGFKEEVKRRDCLLINNEFQSLIIMSILENEYNLDVPIY